MLTICTCIELYLLYNVASFVAESDFVTIAIVFKYSFLYALSGDIDYSSLCCTVDPGCPSLHVIVCC